MADTLTYDSGGIVERMPDGLPGEVHAQLAAASFSGVLEPWTGRPADDALRLLGLAAGFSNAPVSGFHVGAVAVGDGGRLYLGANLEFVGTSVAGTLHAEQSAVLNAWLHGEGAVRAIAVSAAPCGLCRQFLLELPAADSLEILLPGAPATRLGELLPSPFGGGRAAGDNLLDHPAVALEPVREPAGPREALAVEAARLSYAPYTDSPEGFALSTSDGACFAGRTAESIAFNPGVPAIVCALNQRNLSPSRRHGILHACSARLITSLAPQKRQAEAILASLAKADIDEVLLEPA